MPLVRMEPARNQPCDAPRLVAAGWLVPIETDWRKAKRERQLLAQVVQTGLETRSTREITREIMLGPMRLRRIQAIETKQNTSISPFFSGGHGTRTRNPLRGTSFPMMPLAIRLPSSRIDS